jgi:hypothetical protein
LPHANLIPTSSFSGSVAESVNFSTESFNPPAGPDGTAARPGAWFCLSQPSSAASKTAQAAISELLLIVRALQPRGPAKKTRMFDAKTDLRSVMPGF